MVIPNLDFEPYKDVLTFQLADYTHYLTMKYGTSYKSRVKIEKEIKKFMTMRALEFWTVAYDQTKDIQDTSLSSKLTKTFCKEQLIQNIIKAHKIEEDEHKHE